MKKTIDKQNNIDRAISVIMFGAAFFLPALVLLLAYINLQVHPFGHLSVLIGDMNSQYVDYLSSFRDLLTGDASGNIFYSWTTGGGINYFALATYYLISPFNLILLLFSKENITVAILLITLLKVGTSGATFFYYARKTFNIHYLLVLALSLFYALSGFSVIYACNIMWLDTVILLPLFMLGLDALITKGKITLYVVSLFGLFVTNYYLSFMVGIFAIIYFFAKTISQYGFSKKTLKPTGLFALSSSLTIGAAGVVLLPSFYSLMDNYVDGISGRAEFTDDIFGILSKLFVGSYDDITYGLPNLYLGLAPLILVVLYFFNSRIKIRERIASGAVLGIFFLSFLLPKLNLVWHMFRAPTWFPVRYSFLFIFFCLYLCGRCLSNWKNVKWQKIASSGGIVLGLLFLAGLHKGENLTQKELIMNLVFILIYVAGILLFSLVKKKKRMVALVLSIGVFLLSIGEVYINSDLILSDLNNQLRYKGNNTYVDFYEKYSPVADYIEEYDKDKFYRIEHDKIRDANDSMALGINGMSHYSSVSNQSANIFYNKMGMARGYGNRYFRYTGAPNYYDSLMGVKYIMSENGRDDFGYDVVNQINGVTVYENEYALPLAYAVPESAENIMNTMPDENNVFLTVNSYLKDLSGINRNIFELQDQCWVKGENKGNSKRYFVSDNIKFQMNVESDGYYYFRCENNFKEYPQIYVNDTFVAGNKNVSFNGVMALGYFEEGEKITVAFNSIGKNKMVYYSCFARLDQNAYSQIFESLGRQGITLEEGPDSKILGKITLAEDGYIATSIPYDKGWKVKIDGKECEVQKMGDGLMAIKAEKGVHQVEFTFVPRGFGLGLVLSLVSLIAIVMLIILLKNTTPNSPKGKIMHKK